MADAVTPRLVPVERLRPAPWNPRQAPKRRLAALMRAIEADPEFLWHRPILATADGTVYAGNQRLQAAIEMGMTEVPAIIEDIPDDLARARAVRDNTHAGEWVEDALAEIVRSAECPDTLGFDDTELTWLLSSHEDAAKAPSQETYSPIPQDIVRVLVYARDMALAEQAAQATGTGNKGEALRAIIEHYLTCEAVVGQRERGGEVRLAANGARGG